MAEEALRADGIKIWRILHAGYLFEYRGYRILFDPLFESPFSVNCYSFPEVRFDYAEVCKLQVDAIFISHYHEDHCSLESLQYLDRTIPIYMFCVHPEMFEILQQLGFLNVHSICLEQKIEVGSFRIHPHRALDQDVDCLFEIETDSFRVLNVVDSWIDVEKENELACKSWDVMLWPFQTMRELEVLNPNFDMKKAPELPIEWLRQIERLCPRFLVPSSCQFQMEKDSWYNSYFFPISYHFFADEISKLNKNIQILRMDPGVGFHFKNALECLDLPALSWIHRGRDDSVDYAFDPAAKVPSMIEIASFLPDISEKESQFLVRYFEKEVFDRFVELDPDLSLIFYKARVWHLIVYDRSGGRRIFRYSIKTSKIVATEADTPDWITEISAYKLYKALVEAESLNSIYIRIQPQFEGSDSSDVMQDPLLRILYEGRFATYQKEQLKRLTGGP